MVHTLLLVIILVLLTVIILPPHITFIYWYCKGANTISPLSLLGYFVNLVFKNEPLFINLQRFYNTMKGRGYKFGGSYFMVRPIFVPTDVDLIKRMSINVFDHFTDHIGPVRTENDPLSLNLFIAKGFHWQKVRSKLSPAFTWAKSKIMFNTALTLAQDFKQLINKCIDRNEFIDIKEVSECFTTDVTISYGFGIESKALQSATSEARRFTSEFAQSFRTIMLAFFPELVPIFRMATYGEELTNFFVNLMKGTIKHRKQNGIVREDFINHLLQNHTNSDVDELKITRDLGLNLNEMASQCFIFYLAGYETRAAAISFTLAELALNDGIQNKVREEIKVVLEKHNGRITYEAVQEMEYLNSCLFESLRMYPPVPTNTRQCTKSYKIPNSDVVISKGTYVFLPIYAVHRDPEYFPNPDKFDPDRFSKERTKNRPPPAFMPFGDGPRMCIGYKFGILKAKVALVVLLKHFRFFPHPDIDVPLKFSSTFFLNTLNTLKVNAEKLEA